MKALDRCAIASVFAALVLVLGACRSASGRSSTGARDSALALASASGALVRAPTLAPSARACRPDCASIEHCVAGKCLANCPTGEVYVSATGAAGFTMGRGKPGERDAAHTVVLTRPYCVDATEVTVRAYRSCVERGPCTLPELNDANSNYRPEFQRSDHPLNMVKWAQARQYCQSVGKELATEAQWEWAASGGDGRRFPWGNEPEPTCDNGYADFTPGGAPKSDPAGDVGCRGGGTSPVKAHPNGRVSWPAGDIFDFAGNVWEWTLDCYRRYPAETQIDPSPQSHPALHGDCFVRVVRGGGWNRSKFALFTSARAASQRTYQVPGLGFRCVRNAVR